MTDDVFIRGGAGERHNWLLGQVARFMREKPDATYTLLLASARMASFAFCRPPLGDREIDDLCKWIWVRTHDLTEEQRPLVPGRTVRISDASGYEELMAICVVLERIRLALRRKFQPGSEEWRRELDAPSPYTGPQRWADPRNGWRWRP